MIALASFGVLVSMALLGTLVWVVGIALLGQVVARPEVDAVAGATTLGILTLASLLFVVAVVAIEFAVSGAWVAG
jgi:hypothetical protein